MAGIYCQPTKGTTFSPQSESEQDPANNTVAIIGLDATGLALAGHFMHRGCQVLVYQEPDSNIPFSSEESCSRYCAIRMGGGFYTTDAIWDFNTPQMMPHPYEIGQARTIFITKAGRKKEIIQDFRRRCNSKHCFLFVEGGPDYKDLGIELRNSAGVFNIPLSPYVCNVTSEYPLTVSVESIRDSISLESLEQSSEGNAQSLLGIILWPWRHSLGWRTQ